MHINVILSPIDGYKFDAGTANAALCFSGIFPDNKTAHTDYTRSKNRFSAKQMPLFSRYDD